MPRYFFTAQDGRCVPDDQGTELANDSAARIEAVKILGQLLEEGAREFWKTPSLTLTVADEHRLTLFVLDVSGTESPASSRPR